METILMHGLYRYQEKYIESSLSEVTFDLRQSALKPQKHNTAERLVPFVTTYHLAVKKLKQIVMKNWSFIENQPLLKTIFKTPPIIHGNHILQKR